MPPLNARDLTDLQWAVLEVLIPETPCRKDRRGRPWKDRRAVLNGILWILCRLIWKVLHEGVQYVEYGPAVSALTLKRRKQRLVTQLAKLGYSAGVGG
jgi:transposase